MKSAINNEFNEILASEYNHRQHWYEDLFCPVCGEQVTFVRESFGAKCRAAHFKHVSGEKSQECELYIPHSGIYNAALTVIRKTQSASESLAMLVNIKGNSYQFCVGVAFSEEELLYYESKKAEFKISYFVGDQNKSETRLINRGYFSNNHMEKFQLQAGCRDVLISINNTKKYISCADGMTYYHISHTLSDATSIWARKIEKNSLIKSLYVGVKYVLIVPKYAVLHDIYNVIKHIKALPTYDMYLVEISDYSDKAVEVCKKQGYNLKDIREQFDVLWPPIKSNNGIYEVDSNELYAISNFELQYGKNVSCDSLALDEGVYKIGFDKTLAISSETKEFKFALVETRKQQYGKPQIETIIGGEITADDDQYYIYNSQGVQKMVVGQRIKLLPNNFVQQNHKNYPLRKYQCECKNIKYEDWISDALKYYKATEKFIPEEVVYTGGNPHVWQYIRKIKNSGQINCCIKRRILEKIDD